MKEPELDWCHIQDADQLDSPALVIYPARIQENIRLLISMVEGDLKRLRPHVKTNKSKEVCQLMMDAGIGKFKCATIAEAEMLALCNAKDVLLAYQPVGPKLQRFMALLKAFPTTRFSCLIDHPDAADDMSEFFESKNERVPVYLDLNVGMNRTGISPGSEAIALYNNCFNAKGIEPVGLHVYDGHIHHGDLDRRTVDCNKAFAAVLKMKEAIMEKMLPEPIIVAGGTPTFPIHSKREETECSPGTFIYWDRSYQNECPEQSFLPAALVITRVVSLPDTNKICLDLGHKSIASENNLQRRVYFLNAPGLKPLAHSEEHLIVESPPDHSFKPGDILYGLPYHICPTVALYETAYLILDNKITGEWRNVARDRRINF